MRPIWKGSIGFGLVNIPVRLFAATEDKRLKFRYLHSPCHTPLEYRKFCSTCGNQVPWEEIIRGYEYEKDRFVVLSEEEIEAAAEEKDKIIEIEDFVKLKEVDPIYFQKGYYLAPDTTGKKPYALLKNAMQESGKIAIASLVLRSKEIPAAVRVYKDILLLSTMFYPDEVRSINQLPEVPVEEKYGEKELEMAQQLIEGLTSSFKPEKYQDDYRRRVMEIIEDKVQGREVSVPPSPQKEKVTDLVDALEASVEKIKKEKVNK